jgi:hypothetical protein
MPLSFYCVRRTQLALYVVEAADLLREGALEGGRLGVELANRLVSAQSHVYPSQKTYVAEIHASELAQCRNDLAANLIGNVQLRQGHVRRAEHGVLWWRHRGSSRDRSSGEVRVSREMVGAGLVVMVDEVMPLPSANDAAAANGGPCASCQAHVQQSFTLQVLMSSHADFTFTK